MLSSKCPNQDKVMSSTDMKLAPDVSDCQRFGWAVQWIMSRWNPNARGRLEQAALELYSERGFEQTTVADIASRAGLAERTFFRHFADKREVLFGGSKGLQELLVNTVAAAPDDLTPIEAVATALEAAELFFSDRREHSRKRQRILDANVELQEREVMKLASLSVALAEVLRGRGVSDLAAGLTADAGVAIFKVACARWIDETGQRNFREFVQESLEELRIELARP
jgi:AcrR family transcriptional regulator